ncbi:MAG: hypothetical protein HUU15_15870 [Candidatus Brocadiae bacterium]|nr:hypothetical protein [Candidatus Brocadiia bacterium]
MTVSYMHTRGAVILRSEHGNGTFREYADVSRELPSGFDYPLHVSWQADSVLLIASYFTPRPRATAIQCTREDIVKLEDIVTKGTVLQGQSFKTYCCSSDLQRSRLFLTGEQPSAAGSIAIQIELDASLRIVSVTQFPLRFRIRKDAELHVTDSSIPDLHTHDGPFSDHKDGLTAVVWIAGIGDDAEAVVGCIRNGAGEWEGPLVLREAKANSLFLPSVCVGPDKMTCFSWCERMSEEVYSLRYCLAGSLKDDPLLSIQDAAAQLSFPQHPGFSRQSAWHRSGFLLLGWCGAWGGTRGVFIATCRLRSM